MKRKTKKLVKHIQGMSKEDQKKTIQAMQIEGVQFDVALDSLLDGRPVTGVNGTQNLYNTYSSQVTATYKKYCGEDEFGNDQVRAMVDSRTAFIAGEGLSLATSETVSEGHKELFKKFLELNKLKSIRLFDIVRTTEMSGYAITAIIKTNEKQKFIPILGLFQNDRGATFYQPVFRNIMNPYDIVGFEKTTSKDKSKETIANSTYIRTGGYGCFVDYPTTKVGVVLTEAENYDRALKDMRELNYRCSRITPDFETKSSAETKAIQAQLQAQKWKIGQARIGTAKFDYKVPTGAHENLKLEMLGNLKTMSGVSSVPVHWFGWVDQMSNRATAQELYAMVNNGTIMERGSLETALREILIKMQEVYIDSGGDLISEVTEDFEVRLPLIDFGRFESTVKAYSLLHADGVVSRTAYRNIVPGIDPMAEQILIDEELEKEMVTMSEFDDDEDNPDIEDKEGE